MPTLSKDGRIRIPADLRRRHGWAPGQELEAVDTGSGVVLRPVSPETPPPADREAVLAALDRLGEVAAYRGPRIPVEKLGIDGPAGLDYHDVYPDGP